MTLNLTLSETTRCQIFWASLVVFAVVTLAHLLALPVSLSYDSRDYIRMADALFTSGFPADFAPRVRTPGYSALLRLSFEVFGRQPLAIVGGNILLAGAAVMALAFVIRRVAGPLGAAATLLVVGCCPLLIAYEHFALSEAGSFAYLALLTALLCWRPHVRWRVLAKALLLALLLAIAYQHRPPLLALAPLVALLFCAWHWPRNSGNRRQAFALLALCVAAILLLPQLGVRAYAPYIDTAAMTDMTVRQGVVRQVIVPPGDPRLGADADAYAALVAKTERDSGLISGLPIEAMSVFTDRMFTAPGALFQSPERTTLTTLAQLAANYPGRYLLGATRTLLLYTGFKGYQSTNRNTEMAVIGILDRGRNEVGASASGTEPGWNEAVVHDFEQKTAASLTSHVLWALVKPYRVLQLAAGFALFIAFAAGLLYRNLPLLTLSAPALGFWVMHAAILASEDRYGFPAMPIALAVLCALPGLLYRAHHASKPLAVAA